ncbi:MAG: glycosyltransferase family 1 protein [Myxococcales bacterium]|nr:glycosyltransferase family 1 protein [Myxococcales bacterium]
MKITIVSIGTRGDVQPYVALGAALTARGHQVTLATHEEYEPFVRSHGLEFRPMRGNLRALAGTEAGRAWLASGESPRAYARTSKALLGPIVRPWCEDADAAVEGADAVVFYIMAIGAHFAAERRGLPAIAVAPWPMIPTVAGPPLTMPALRWLPGFALRALGHWAYRFVGGVFHDEYQAHRAAVGLPPMREPDAFHHVFQSGTPTLGLFSETVVPRPYDWAQQHQVAGFAFLPPRSYEPPAALARFLEAGPPPVYVGFGSMTGFDPQALATLALGAARKAGVRVILSSGWAGLRAQTDETVHVVDDVPHDWLFRRVAAVVHHGGVGTFAEGLRAGCPTVITSFFGDQPYWGWRNEVLGTGPRTLSRKGLTTESLGAALEGAVNHPAYRANAAKISEALRAEEGAAHAAARIERHLARS